MMYTQGVFMCKGDHSKHFTFHGGPSWTPSPNVLVFFMLDEQESTKAISHH